MRYIYKVLSNVYVYPFHCNVLGGARVMRAVELWGGEVGWLGGEVIKGARLRGRRPSWEEDGARSAQGGSPGLKIMVKVVSF